MPILEGLLIQITISLIKNYLKVGGSLNKRLLMFKVGLTSYAVQ